jgi:hypothetical protein
VCVACRVVCASVCVSSCVRVVCVFCAQRKTHTNSAGENRHKIRLKSFSFVYVVISRLGLIQLRAGAVFRVRLLLDAAWVCACVWLVC